MRLNIKITEAFLDNPLGVLSIHQLAKKLDIPYGTAYNRIHLLQELGVVTITPQGKAKLCSLVPHHPITCSLAGLVSATHSAATLTSGTPLAALCGKVRQILVEQIGGHVHAAMILNAPGLPADLSTAEAVSLDLFLLAAENGIDVINADTDLEPKIMTIAPQLNLTVTKMVVSPSMLTGMLQEKENSAGVAAFAMLHRGLLLFGFERFWDVVLRAFAR